MNPIKNMKTVLKKQDRATKLTNVELDLFCKRGLVQNLAGGLSEALQIRSPFQEKYNNFRFEANFMNVFL